MLNVYTYYMKNKSLALVFFIFCCICTILAQTKHDKPLNVLFLGNSHTLLNNIPNMVMELSLANGNEINSTMRAIGGRTLYEHSIDTATTEIINSKPWNYVVLQGTGRRVAYPDSFPENHMEIALQNLNKTISNNYNLTKVVFVMIWADESGMTWLPGWTQDYETMQKDIYDKSLEFADKYNMIIAPVGWAWYQVLHFKDFPLHYLHKEDWSHASLKGSYLAACTIFSTITMQSSFKNTYISDLETADASFFQKSGSKVVFDDLELWNIIADDDTSQIADSTTFLSEKNIHNIGNYPNPFINKTNIQFALKQPTNVKIEVLDISGKKLFTLLDEFKQSGEHTILFDGSNLPKGLYFFSLKTHGLTMVKKMMCAN